MPRAFILNALFPRAVWLAALLLFASLIAPAPRCLADSLSLPLGGYYRAGKYFPAQYLPDEANPKSVRSTAKLTISDENLLTTSIAAPATGIVAPLLPLDQLNLSIDWSIGDQSGNISPSDLHELTDDQRLVALAGVDSSAADALFPDNQVIAVELDSAAPLPGAAMAWESLDALVCTPAALARITPQTQQNLIALGVTLAVTENPPAQSPLKWNRQGNLWISSSIAPNLPAVSDMAYDPTQYWTPGRSEQFRSTIVLAAVLICIGVLSIALWRSRWMAAGQIAFCAIAIAGLAAWNNTQSPIDSIAGDVYLNGVGNFTDRLMVRDRWEYQFSARPDHFTATLQPTTAAIHPVLIDLGQAQKADLKLTCDSRGLPLEISGNLAANNIFALVSRSVEPITVETEINTRSPLRLLMNNEIYSDGIIEKEFKMDGNDWPGMVLDMKGE